MFKKANKKDTVGIVTIKNPETKKDEAWIWVEGYKGTDKDMMCRDYQYEIGKQFDMPKDAKIKECESGFHLCLTLKDVFEYYPIGEGRRFFKVRALVRKEALDGYGKEDDNSGLFGNRTLTIGPNRNLCWANTYKNKLAAISIEFIEELTVDEILADTDAADLPEKYKQMAIEQSVFVAVTAHVFEEQIEALMELGYCEAFAKYVVEDIKEYDIAYAVGMQKDLSMDMKVFAIMKKPRIHELPMRYTV